MHFKDISEIRNAVSHYRNGETYQDLKTRLEGDFDLYRLQPYSAGSGLYSYTSNYPRVYADKMIALAVGSKLIIRIPMELMNEAGRQQASNIERFLYGVFNANDERLMHLSLPSLRDQLAWHACIRGGFGLFTFLHKTEEGKTVPVVDVWDRYNMAYGQGRNGTLWAAQIYDATAEELADEYGTTMLPTKGRSIEVYRYVDREVFGVFALGEWLQEPVEHGLGYCPVSVFKVGSLPPVKDEMFPYSYALEGESIFAPIRGLIPLFNKTMSDHLSIVRRGVKPALGYWSSGGKKTMDTNIYEVEKGATVPMDMNEKIEPLWEPTIPKDSNLMVQILSGELQRGGLPHTSFGELGFRLSGFAINQLQSSIETTFLPVKETLNRAYKIAAMQLTTQFADQKTGSFPPIKIRGRTSRGEVFGVPETITVSPSDIKGDWHPEVRLDAVLPKDDAQRYYLANLARQGETPLLSLRTIRDKLLEVEDPDLEQELLDEEWAAQLPITRLFNALKRAIFDDDLMGAQNIIAQLEMLQAGTKTGSGGAGVTVPEGGLAEMAGGMEGVGMPSGETGLPSSILPSESLGGLPGGAAGAKMPVEGEA